MNRFDKSIADRELRYLLENESLRGEIDRFSKYVRLEEIDTETLIKILKIVIMLKGSEDKA